MSTVPAPPAKKPFYKRTWFIVLVAIFVLGAIGSQMKGKDTSSATAPTPAAQSESSSTPAAKIPEEAKPAEKEQIPVEYRSALNKAKTYSDVMHMSKGGLYSQLTSEFEQFSPEAAQYAVDNVQADWNANALAKAKVYQEEMSMSPGAIYDQLVSEFEQFTPEEAQYAVDNLG